MTTATLENERLLEEVAEKHLRRRDTLRPVTRNQVIALVKQIGERMEQQRADGAHSYSLSRIVRGLCSLRKNPINADFAQADAEYVSKALSTGATPGSYLVPRVQAQEIISQLAQLATARASGAKIWPMQGIQKLDVPAAVAGSPNFVWMAQNSIQTPSDLNAAQIAFDLKRQSAFELLPIQLFKSASPQWDVMLEQSFALGLAESEDAAMHATSTLSNAPLALMSQSGITTLNANNNSANGGSLLYADLLALMQKAVDAKIRPPWAWFMNGRTWLRCLSLQGTVSNPVVIPGPEGIGPQVGHLLGWPVFVTASIATNEAVGSGSNQSHIVLTNPRGLHIAESGDVSLEVSLDFAFDSAQVALRISHLIDFGFQPAAGICVLQGVN